MSWISELCATYDNLMESGDFGDIPPLPISHSLQNAHVEIRLDKDGRLKSIRALPKSEAATIIPVTEDSASRSSGIAPHVLYDKLAYIAKGCAAYTGEKKQEKCYEAYIGQLKEWADCDNTPYEVKAIYEYVKNGTVIQDLINCGILVLDADGKLSKVWTGEKDNKPLKTSDTFVRFIVYDENGGFKKCNENFPLFRSFTEFYDNRKTERRICYVTGETAPCTEKHPSKIRNSGDMAKLISANDTSGFTFRGRFKNSSDAVSVSYKASQKAHNALRWLVQNYGWHVGDETIVAWSVQGDKYPSLRSDTYDMEVQSRWDCSDDVEEYETASDIVSGGTIADIRKAVNGYRTKYFNRNGQLNNMIVMGLEAATPGRLSVTMYHKLHGSVFLDRIEEWHTGCSWHHNYKTLYTEKDGSTEVHYVDFTGAPSPEDIVKAAYGENVNDKIKKDAIKRIVEFIVTGGKSKFPCDLMKRIVAKVSNPVSLKDWELARNTSIACAIVKLHRKIFNQEECSMELNVSNELQHERNFMFGRLLAYMEQIENDAIYQQVGKEGDKRVPNAVKLRSIFVQRPADTLIVLNNKLSPYIERTYYSWGGEKFREMQDLITEMTVSGFLKEDKSENNFPLDERYIMGYSCQMSEFRARKTKKENKENNENND